MERIETNKGDYSILQQMPGAEIKDRKQPTPEKKKTQPDDEPEWMAEAQRRWRSIHNDALFTPF